ncbi:hypothetical protein LBW59_25425, partial [Ralstonia solanacearum]
DRDEESLVRVLNLRVRLLDETLVSEFHMGQQAAACANWPDISVLPYLSSNMPNSLQSGRRPHKRLLMASESKPTKPNALTKSAQGECNRLAPTHVEPQRIPHCPAENQFVAV